MCIKYGILGENMGQTTLKHETTIETAKALPAVAGATAASLTLNECVALATFCYILLQSAYLIWKWRKEAKKDK
jgi:hypothetical protein